MNIQIAIDGPAGSGKSTISHTLAERLGFTHIETGAFFRAITLKALALGVDLKDESVFSFLKTTNIKLVNKRLYLDDKDVTDELRNELITKHISVVASHKVVRDEVINYERESAKSGNIIMDGRDIGTVVLPNATLKFFLTADPKVRAKRRFLELENKGLKPNYNEIFEDLKLRDLIDSNRELAPLKQASDAILIDTSDLSFTEVINIIENKIKELGV